MTKIDLIILLMKVEIKRFELLTSCLQSRRSNQLSYIPNKVSIAYWGLFCRLQLA